MTAPEAPTAADRYLRSIAFAASAVMVGVLTFPLAAGLALAGLILQEAARDSEPFGFSTFGVSQTNDHSVLVSALYGAAIGVAALGVVTFLVLALRSLVALRRAGKAPTVTRVPERRPTAAPASKRPGRRASSLAAPPMLASRPAPANGSGDAVATAANERVVVLTDSEKLRLADVAPFSPAAGWYVDPLGQSGGRWWNGNEWTGRLQG